MNYILHYDIAALIISVTVILHHFIRRNVKTKAATLFVVMMILQLTTATLDIVTALMIDKAIPATVTSMYVWNALYLLTFNAITPVFLCYLLYITKGDDKTWTKLDYVKVWGPYAIDFIFIVSTPWTDAVFYVDENLNYGHHWPFYIIYAISIMYLFIGAYQIVRNRHNVKKQQIIVVIFFISVTIGSIVIQMFIPNLLIIQFFTSIAFFLIYLSLENPDNYIDSSVGILNREGYILTVRAALDRKKSFRLVGVYLSGLRYLNETIGVENKKRLIRDIVKFLSTLNGSRNVFRLSNTKFVIFLEDDKELEKIIINSINERFETPFEVNKTDVPLSPTMAILRCPEDADALDNVMDLMDYSMNELVENTEAGIIYAGEDVVTKRHREGRILQILNRSILEQDFEMYYQPIFSVADRRYNSAEALLRLKSSDIGYISPDEFIPIAEKNGMILDIGEFVFRSVCKFIIDNNVARYGIEQIHINLSVVQCMQDDLAEKFLDIMSELELPSHRIKLEVTETAAVVSSASLSMNMNALHDAGIMFALDDYGTGFSNAISLIEYPYSTIKIDKSVVWAAMENDNAKKVLAHTVSMLKDLNMSIVAEGVETYEQTEELISMGVDYLQGYYYSRPISGKDFIELVSIDLKM